MAREFRSIDISVRVGLLQRARAERTDFQILLTRCVLKPLFYRLSISDQHKRFVLQGAMLLAILQDDPYRPTRDLDLLGHADPDPAGNNPCTALVSAASRRQRTIMLLFSIKDEE